MSEYGLPLCQRYTPSSSQPSAPGDPAPLVSDLMFHSSELKKHPAACVQLLEANRRSEPAAHLVYTRHSLDPEDRARDGHPLNVRRRAAAPRAHGAQGAAWEGAHREQGHGLHTARRTRTRALTSRGEHRAPSHLPPPPSPHVSLTHARAYVRQVTGVTCTIVIRRFYTQYIMTALLPLIASTWLGFVIFLLPRCARASAWGVGARGFGCGCIIYFLGGVAGAAPVCARARACARMRRGAGGAPGRGGTPTGAGCKAACVSGTGGFWPATRLGTLAGPAR
jgi:hypothetical protein